MTTADMYAGCHETPKHLYRPMVIVTHGSIYFSPATYEFASRAISEARAAMSTGAYEDWHSHKLVGDEE